MVEIAIRVSSSPEHSGDIAKALGSLAIPAQAEAGHIKSMVLREVGQPGDLWYVELWASRQAAEHRIRSPRFADLISMLETSIQEPALEVRFVSSVEGLAYVGSLRAGPPES